MSRTSPLTVIGDYSMDEKTINIHPNDGFDLGLMTTEYAVRIHVGREADADALSDEAFIHGRIILKNDVRNGHVELGLKNATRLGDAKRAVIQFEKGDQYGTVLVNPA